MLFHFANRAKNQKLLAAIHPQSSHEQHTSVTFSSTGYVVLFAPLIHTLSFCHFCLSLICICAEKGKGPTLLGLSTPSFGTRIPRHYSNFSIEDANSFPCLAKPRKALSSVSKKLSSADSTNPSCSHPDSTNNKSLLGFWDRLVPPSLSASLLALRPSM
jgi:hypothetical protein